MYQDIYNRNPQDPNYKDNQLEMDDRLELFKQQIESCLFTPKTSVMGDVNMGASLDEFIWSFRTSSEDINFVVNNQIQQYCTMAYDFPYVVNTQFYAGTVRDIAVLNVEIDNRDRFNVIIS